MPRCKSPKRPRNPPSLSPKLKKPVRFWSRLHNVTVFVERHATVLRVFVCLVAAREAVDEAVMEEMVKGKQVAATLTWNVKAVEEKLAKERAAWNKRRDQLDADMAKLTAELRENNSDFIKERVEMQRETQNVRQKLLASMARADNFKEQLDTAHRDMAQMTEDNRLMAGKCTHFQTQIKSLQAQIKMLSDDLVAAKDTIQLNEESTKEALAAADVRRKQELDHLRGEWRHADKEWQAQVDRAQADIDDLRSQRVCGDVVCVCVWSSTGSRRLSYACVCVRASVRVCLCVRVCFCVSQVALETELDKTRANLNSETKAHTATRGTLEELRQDHAAKVQRIEELEQLLSDCQSEVAARDTTIAGLHEDNRHDKETAAEELKKIINKWTRKLQAANSECRAKADAW